MSQGECKQSIEISLAQGNPPHLRGMTFGAQTAMFEQHFPPCMYRLLNKAVEELSPVRRGPDLRVDNADAELVPCRSEGVSPSVNLPEFHGFEVRWTSLAA